MGLGPGTVHSCGRGRLVRTILSGRPAVKCSGCGATKYAGTTVDRGVRVHNPWEQTEREANRK